MNESMDLDQLAKDAAESQTRRNITLQDVIALAERQQLLETEVEALDAQLAAKKKEYRKVAEEELPELFNALGMPFIGLPDGSTVKVDERVSASITDDNRKAAHAFVREVGAGDIIKNVVSITFGQGEDAEALRLLSELQQRALKKEISCGAIEQKEQIHPSTLKAFVKERRKAQLPIPAETFKLFEGQVATIKKPRPKV